MASLKKNKKLVVVLSIAALLSIISMCFFLKDLHNAYIQQQQKSYFKQSMQRFLQSQLANLPENTVLVMGDSMVQGMAVSSIHPNAVNFGIGSETSLETLSRLRSYAPLEQAACVIVVTGVNDVLNQNTEHTFEHLKVIIRTLPSTKPIFISQLLPVDETIASRQGLNKRIEKINQQILELQNHDTQVYVLRYNTIFGRDGLDKNLHRGDGLHLNAKGYVLWISSIKQQVGQVCGVNP